MRLTNSVGASLAVRLLRPHDRCTLEFRDGVTGELIVRWDALDFARRARTMAAPGAIPLNGRAPNRWCLDAAAVETIGEWVLREAERLARVHRELRDEPAEE